MKSALFITLLFSVSFSVSTIKDNVRIRADSVTLRGGSLAVDSTAKIGKRPTSTNLHTIAGWENGNDTVKQMPIDSITSDSVAHADHADTADVAFKSLSIAHGVTHGTVPKAVTDSMFTDSHISENGDTVIISGANFGGDSAVMQWVSVGESYNTSGAYSVEYGGGNFVAIGPYYGTGFTLMNSTNGTAWSGDTFGGSIVIKSGVAYAYNRFLLYYNNSSFLGGSSISGSDWVALSSSGLGALCVDAEYGDGTYIIINYASPGYFTSNDGSTFSYLSPTSGYFSNAASIAYGAGRFVVVCNNTPTRPIITSTNGIDWSTSTTMGSSVDFSKVEYLNGSFWATSSKYEMDGFGGRVLSDTCLLTSPDGLTWFAINTAPLGKFLVRDIAYGNGWYVAAALDSGYIHNVFLTSPNGFNWYVNYGTNPSVDGVVTSITFGDSLFVVAHSGGTVNQFMYSSGPALYGEGHLIVETTSHFRGEVKAYTVPVSSSDSILTLNSGNSISMRPSDSLDVDSARSAGRAKVADSTAKVPALGIANMTLPYVNSAGALAATTSRYDPVLGNYAYGTNPVSTAKIYNYWNPVNSTAIGYYSNMGPGVTTNGTYGATSMIFFCSPSIAGGVTDAGDYRGVYTYMTLETPGTMGGGLTGNRILFGTNTGAGTIGTFCRGIDLVPYAGAGTITNFAAIKLRALAASGATFSGTPYVIDSDLPFASRLNGSVVLDDDTTGVVFGETQQSRIGHNGTNMVYNNTVGSHLLSGSAVKVGSVSNSTDLDSTSIKSRKWMDTPEGGRAIKIVNRTGAASVKGYMVHPSPSYDTSCTLSIVDVPDPIGIIYEAGVADGSEMWVVTNGYADVYFIGNATRGHIARGFVTGDAGYVAGQVLSEAVPSAPFATDKHFYEIGHVVQSRTGAGLARCVLHQN